MGRELEGQGHGARRLRSSQGCRVGPEFAARTAGQARPPRAPSRREAILAPVLQQTWGPQSQEALERLMFCRGQRTTFHSDGTSEAYSERQNQCHYRLREVARFPAWWNKALIEQDSE